MSTISRGLIAAYLKGEIKTLTNREQKELARIALASLEAEAVGEVVLGEYDDCGCHPGAKVVCIAADGQADWGNFKDGTRLYAAPPSLVVIDEREAFNTWNNDENLPIAGVCAKNAAWLAWQARAKLTAPPAPVSVPDERPSLNNGIVGFDEGWNACRAAMLQSFGNSEQLHSPVIPAGWVACSERMPGDLEQVYLFTNGVVLKDAFYNADEQLFYWEYSADTCKASDASHWMPMIMPAAPQQEVK